MQRPEDDDLILEPGGAGPGRPFIGRKIAVRITPACLTRLDQFAAESGLSRSELIRSAVEWYVAATLRPPQEHDSLRSEIEAQAEARGLSPAALLGVGYGSVLARRGGGK